MKMIWASAILSAMSTTARCEKVYRTFGMYSTQSPNQKVRAILDTANNEIKIIDMSDSSIIENLEGCAHSIENLPSWQNDSVFTFSDVQRDSISLYAFELKNGTLTHFGKQSRRNQNFSRTIVLLWNRKEFGMDMLKQKYEHHRISTGCE
jgi:hypothetical protein